MRNAFSMTVRTAIAMTSLLLLAACGGGDDPTTNAVASASDLAEPVETVDDSESTDDAATASATETSVTAEDAALAMSACMRDNGWDDFPDPVIGNNGQPNLRQAIAESGIDFTTEGFRDQIDVCRTETGADQFGAGGNREQAREQIQESLLGYTQCLRDEGLDVGDLGAPGEGAGQGQNAQGDGQGAGQQGGQRGALTPEQRNERIAGALGLDVDDPTTQAAMTTCEPVLLEAFAQLGQPPA